MYGQACPIAVALVLVFVTRIVRSADSVRVVGLLKEQRVGVEVVEEGEVSFVV